MPPIPDPQRSIFGFSELKQWLRHRHPMVLLDRIIEHTPGRALTAIHAVSGSSDWAAGHFPERAIYPGSHLIQAFSQAAIVLCQTSTTPLEENELTLVSAVQARFLRPVVPGDCVHFDVMLERHAGAVFQFSGRARVSDARVAAFRLTLTRVQLDRMGTVLW